MNNIIPFAHNEITVVKSNDVLDKHGLFKQIELKIGEMKYQVVEDELLEHWSNGYCIFCKETFTDFEVEHFCEHGEKLLSAVSINEIKNKLEFEWSINFQNYEIKTSYPNLDTYHIILKFKDNNKLVEVILTTDSELKVSLLNVCGSIPASVGHIVKETIVKDLLEEYKLHAIISVMPIDEELLGDILRDKCTNEIRASILHAIYSNSKVTPSKLPKERQVKFIMESYNKNEGDKAEIMRMIKMSLVNVPLN